MIQFKISESAIEEARVTAQRSGKSFIEVFEENSGLEAGNFVTEIALALNYPVKSMDDLHQMTAQFDVITYADSTKRHCIVLHDATEDASYAVIADAFNHNLRDWLSARIKQPFKFAIAHHRDIAAVLTRNEENMRALDGLSGQRQASPMLTNGIEDISLLSISNDSSHVVKLVHSTLYDALRAGVSDIHLETGSVGLTIKYRIDGVLTTVASLEGIEHAEQVISRIKIMSELDIAERRVPQDGRFKVALQGREVDFRISIMPNIHGEDAVLRILDRTTIADQMTGLRLEQLGFDETTIKYFRKMSHEPYGMVLVTGPTGSGKTTTLYAAISEINDGRDKIITIEDPVEYQLPGILQIPVNEKKGLTFARGLRSILRHDPDKIMVGEIRDAETAQIAIQSALTGHLVFTTVHANNVFDVISRFSHMGVDAYSFVSAMNGIASQRLVRVICMHCRASDMPSAELLEISGLKETDVSSYKFSIGRGCGQCRGTGYKGRKAIAEMLDLNDEIREMIVNRASIREIKEAARKSGTRYLREVALDSVKSGETTLQEINRVTFVD